MMLTEFTRGRARDAGPGTTFMVEVGGDDVQAEFGTVYKHSITSATTGWKCGDAGGGFRQMHGVSRYRTTGWTSRCAGLISWASTKPLARQRAHAVRVGGVCCAKTDPAFLNGMFWQLSNPLAPAFPRVS